MLRTCPSDGPAQRLFELVVVGVGRAANRSVVLGEVHHEGDPKQALYPSGSARLAGGVVGVATACGASAVHFDKSGNSNCRLVPTATDRDRHQGCMAHRVPCCST